MIWTRDAFVSDSARGTAVGLNPQRYEADAYRCENLHVSDECAVCRSRDTTRTGNGPREGQRIVQCNPCGNTSTVEIDH
jgi:hypothetical protein